MVRYLLFKTPAETRLNGGHQIQYSEFMTPPALPLYVHPVYPRLNFPVSGKTELSRPYKFQGLETEPQLDCAGFS